MNDLEFFAAIWHDEINAIWIYKNFDCPDKKHSDNLYVDISRNQITSIETAMPYADIKVANHPIFWGELPDCVKQFCNETYRSRTAIERAVRFDYSGYSIK